MATGSLQADRYEKFLAGGAIVLLLLVAVALVRGHADLARIPPVIAAHLALVVVPLVLTPIQLLRRRAGTAHRWLGWTWAISLFATAALSFGIHASGPGRFSFIHILSVVTVVAVPLMVLAAMRRDFARHRRGVRGLVTGALLVAGYFTLIPGRMLGEWLWG
jgi:uncharacterized membrane protein